MKRLLLAAACFARLAPLAAQPAKQTAQEAADLVNAGRYEEAAAKYREAILLEPSNASFHLSLGLARQAVGGLEDAVRSIQRAVSLAPDDPRPHYSLALLHEARAVEARRRGDDAARRLELSSARTSWEKYARLEKNPERLKTAEKHLFTLNEQLKN